MSVSCTRLFLPSTPTVRVRARVRARPQYTQHNQPDKSPTTLLTSPFDGQIFELSGPALLTLAADPLLSIIDTLYVGRLGSVELAALGVNTAVFALAFTVFNFLAMTTAPLVASAVASDKREEAGRAAVQSCLLAVALGLPLMIGLEAFSQPILHIMGAGNDILPASQSYLLTRSPLQIPLKNFSAHRAIAAPSALISLSGIGIFRGLKDTRTPLYITLAANSINFILDPILIYGLHMGIQGAALSTAFAEIASSVAYCILLWRQRSSLGLDAPFSKILKTANATYRPFLISGGTLLLRTSVLIAAKTLASSVATRLGSTSIAAHQVVSQLWLLHSLLCDALAIAGTSIVAGELASDAPERARAVSDRLLQLAVVLGLVDAIVYGLGSPIVPLLFTEDAAVKDAINRIWWLAVMMLPMNSVAFVFDGIFVGAKDFKYMATAMTGTSMVAMMGMLLVVPLHWGLFGVWSCQSALMLLRGMVLGVRYAQTDGPLPPLPPIREESE